MVRKLKDSQPTNFASAARKRKTKQAPPQDAEYESVLGDPESDIDPEDEELDDLEVDEDELEMGKKPKKARKPKAPKPVKTPKEDAGDTIKFPFDLGGKLLLKGSHAVRSLHRLTPEEVPSVFLDAQKAVTQAVTEFVEGHPKQAGKVRDFVAKMAAHELSMGGTPGSEWEYRWFVTIDKQFNLYVGIHPQVKGLPTKKLLSLFAKG